LILTGSSFIVFAIAALLYSLTYSFFTGTDHALIYDTAKELGEEKTTLRRLGRYQSARSVLKVFSVLIAALIAKDLTEAQFTIIILLDIFFNIVAIITSGTLEEANHYMDVEKQEAGALFDAWRLITKNKAIMMGMLGKSLVFVAGFILVSYHQDFLVSLGVGIIMLGVFHTFRFLFEFLFNRYAEYFIPKSHVMYRIRIINLIITLSTLIFIGLYYFDPKPFLLMVFFEIILLMGAMQTVFYSEFFNKQSHSYNRATTLSLTNFMKSILEIPFYLLSAFLVVFSPIYPYVISLVLVCVVLMFLRIHKNVT